MFEGITNLIGGMITPEQKADATKDIIQDALEKIAVELNAPFSDFRIEISPIDAEFNFKCHIFQVKENKHYKIREITVAEIVGVKQE